MSEQPSHWTAEELRRAWLQFWSLRGHTIAPSGSLIPTHPSAPMFTNSGMMPFVPYFLGEDPVPFDPPRATSIQKCVRAGGKHNDLDAIGRSLRHLSFFEMLGNFSFGNYFKREAIVWAWEFVTKVLKVDGNRIWVTVHLTDDEAADIWRKEVGLPAERIQRLDKDNFWEMGETGPCGPSSELFYDFGPEHGPDGGPENPASESRFIEFWNLVFMQFYKDTSGALTPLANKHIDTGAGLERIVGLLRGSPSLFACDTLEPLVQEMSLISDRAIGVHKKDDVAMRLIADHARSTTFLLADGIVPSNEGRGYVLRRIIRRAIRYSYLLGVETEVMRTMTSRVIELHRDVYPEVQANADSILAIVVREEARFRRTLRVGLDILEGELRRLPEGDALPGAVVFSLHDTHGFPLEITAEIAQDHGRQVDVAEFRRLMADQRVRGRASTKRGSVVAPADVQQSILDVHGPTMFVGRSEFNVRARVVGIVRSADGGAEVFLDRSPFYAEQGGQVGDVGTLTMESGAVLRVINTTRSMAGLHSHSIAADPQQDELEVDDEVDAAVDATRRSEVCRNHTATHLLHWALRETLGDHVKQHGSLVAPERLRFDFSHFDALSETQLRAIEDLVNREVLNDSPVDHYETSQAAAIESGAMALFGEKYGDRVRVVRAGPHSLELCGGTHVGSLGEIGLVKIVSEGSIGANLRRIEAVTGFGVLRFMRQRDEEMRALATDAGVPTTDFAGGLHRRLAELQMLRTEHKALAVRFEQAQVRGLIAAANDKVLVARVERVDADGLKRLAASVLKAGALSIVVLGSVPDSGKPAVCATVSETSWIKADGLLEPVSRHIGGGRGKNPKVSLAGGVDASKLDDALDAVRALIAATAATAS